MVGFDSEQFSRFGEVLGALAVGKQAVVSNPVKAVWRDVDEEASDELGGFEGHGLVAIFLLGPVVLPLKNDTVFIAVDETRVGDRDAMGVAREILEDGVRPGKWGSSIDVPVKVSKGSDELFEGSGVVEMIELTEEGQAPGALEFAELIEEHAAESAREYFDGQEEVRARGDPVFAIEGEPAARNDAMKVRMMGHGRTPSVEHGGETEASP